VKRRDAVETVVEMRQDLTRHLLAQVRYLVALIRACAVASRLTICTWLDRSATFGLSANAAAPAAEWRNQDPPPDIGFPLARAFCQGGVKKLALPPAMRKRSRLEGETGRRVGPMALNAA